MHDLLCIGNALVDVFADVTPDFCERFGLTEPVQHISPQSAAALFSALPQDGIVIRSGGNAANTAKIAARLGVKTAFAGAIGFTNSVCGASDVSNASNVGSENIPDQFGAIFEEELQHSGVSLYLSQKHSPTGIFFSLSLKENGNNVRRVIAASPSAALELDKNDLCESLFEQVKILYIESFLLDRKDLVSYVVSIAEKNHLTLAMDAGTAEMSTKHAEYICSWFGVYPFIFFMNEKEAESFAFALGSSSDWASLFTTMSREYSNNSVLIVVKLAERGAVVFSGGERYYVKTEPLDAADSTGAGDAFAAGFLTALLQGESPKQCAHAGNVAAASVLRVPGTGMKKP